MSGEQDASSPLADYPGASHTVEVREDGTRVESWVYRRPEPESPILRELLRELCSADEPEPEDD